MEFKRLKISPVFKYRNNKPAIFCGLVKVLWLESY